jgi:two-component system OmpR family response regulator
VRKVLVVEDDSTLLEVLGYNLSREGYHVITAADGVRALEMARRETPHLIILDIMLPELDGLEVCRILRKEMTVPILMLTAKGEEIDKVVGLELGADDYMTKPFSLRELMARVRAMLRRADMAQEKAGTAVIPPAIKAGNLEIDLARHQVTLAGSTLDLSPKEFELLAFLVKNRGIVFSRDQLLEKVWGYGCEVDTRTVDVHIRWLREKIESNPSKPCRLLTVRGVGYRFEG